jgi:very-short-patch-repair endonuclease
METIDKTLVKQITDISKESVIPKIYKLKLRKLGEYNNALDYWKIENNFYKDDVLTLNELENFIYSLSKFEIESDDFKKWLQDLTLEDLYINTDEGNKVASFLFENTYVQKKEFNKALNECLQTLARWKINLLKSTFDKIKEVENHKKISSDYRVIELRKQEEKRIASLEAELKIEKTREKQRKALLNAELKIEKNRAKEAALYLKKLEKLKKEKDERLRNFNKDRLYLTNSEIKENKNKSKYEQWDNYVLNYIDENKIILNKNNQNLLFQQASAYLSSYSRKAFEKRINLLKYFNLQQPLNLLFEHRDTQLYWNCEKSHHWKISIRKMEDRKKGCLDCSGMRARIDTRNQDDNYLYKVAPELRDQYHPENKFDFNKLTAGSARRAKWICPKNSSHIWEAIVFSRVNGSGCSVCSPKSRSLNEIKVLFELANFYSINLEQKKFKNEGVTYFPDILINSHNLVIEYDGSYWHKESQSRDIRKNKYFKTIGFKVIRLRESPLNKIESQDIVVNIKGTVGNDDREIKKAVDHILKLAPPIGTNYQAYIRSKNLDKKRDAQDYYNSI